MESSWGRCIIKLPFRGKIGCIIWQRWPLGFWVLHWSSRQCSIKPVMFLVCAVLVNLAFLLYSFLVVGEICEHFWQLRVWQGRGLLFAGKTSVWEHCHLDCRGIPELEIKVSYLEGESPFPPAKSFLYMNCFNLYKYKKEV